MKRIIDRAGWVLAGALALALIGVAARAIQAGPLDPPGPVASTMRTLGDLPPSWHQVLPANNVADECATQRFTCVMGKNAVLDNETGLVWQIAPSTATLRWAQAVSTCEIATTGGRRGWRIPSPAELSSLSISGIGLPTGHPFTVTPGPYWSSASNPDDAGSNAGYIVTINPAGAGSIRSTESRTNGSTTRVWCVRGAGGGDPDVQSPFPQIWRPTQLDTNDGAFATQSSRFHDIGNTSVVTDRETGLQWQTTPDTSTSNWLTAVNSCARYSQAFVGLGWRLPTLAELLSLYTFAGTGALPTGHPFTGIAGVYWTSTVDAATTANAYTIDTAQVETSTSLIKTATTARHWCVRGGPGD